MNIFNFFKKKSKNEEVVHEQSTISMNDERILKIKNTDCGLLIHEDGEVEIFFTKNENGASISEQEESLMALTLFIKQPGFLPMLLEEFKKIAKVNMTPFQNEK